MKEQRRARRQGEDRPLRGIVERCQDADAVRERAQETAVVAEEARRLDARLDGEVRAPLVRVERVPEAQLEERGVLHGLTLTACSAPGGRTTPSSSWKTTIRTL